MIHEFLSWLRFLNETLVLANGIPVLIMDFLFTFSLIWLGYRLLDRLVSRIFLRGDRHSYPAMRLLMGCVFALCSLDSIVPFFMGQVIGVFVHILPDVEDWYLLCLEILSCIWLAGILFRMTQYCYRRTELMKGLCRLSAASVNDQALEEAVQNSGIASPPPCKYTDGAGSIALCGLRKPMLLISHTFAGRYSHGERYLMYLHECAHLHRRDHWRFLLCDVWEILFWMFPPLQREAQYARECCEIACDCHVLRTSRALPSTYRQMLLRQVEHSHLYQIGFSSSGFSELKARIGATGQKIPHRILRVMVCCCVVLLSALLFYQHPQSQYLGDDWYLGLKIVFFDQNQDVLLIPLDPQNYDESANILLISTDTAQDPEALLPLVSSRYPDRRIQTISLCWISFYWNGALSAHAFGDGRLIYEAAVFFPKRLKLFSICAMY